MTKINPRVDVAFKKIFGVEENKDLLISLINAIVSKEDKVKDIRLLNPYNPQNFAYDKISILDIKAESFDGKRFNIEIQIADSPGYDKRAMYYWAKLYTEQLKQGEDYTQLNKAIGIHILNFEYIHEKKYHNIFNITERESGKRHFDDLELHTIELRKFSKGIDDDFQKLITRMKTKIDIWCAFLTKYDLLENHRQNLQDNDVKKAIDIINVMHFNERERNFYEDHLKGLRDISSFMAKRFEDGKAKGKAEGIKEGVKKSKIEIAMNLLNKKLPLDIISTATGLSVEQLSNLQSDDPASSVKPLKNKSSTILDI